MRVKKHDFTISILIAALLMSGAAYLIRNRLLAPRAVQAETRAQAALSVDIHYPPGDFELIEPFGAVYEPARGEWTLRETIALSGSPGAFVYALSAGQVRESRRDDTGWAVAVEGKEGVIRYGGLRAGLAEGRIVERGDIVDSKTYNVLLSYEKEMDRREKNDQQISVTIMGQIVFIAILVTCFTFYLSLFRKDYFDRIRSTIMIYALITIFTVLSSLMVAHNVLHVYIIPFAMVPIFVRVFMDSRTAFMAHITMILMCATVLQHPLDFIAVEVVAGLVAIFSLRELSSRSQLFWTAVLVALASTMTNVALDWVRHDSITRIDYSDLNYLIFNGLLLFCSYPLLYLIEKTFGFTSNITLIELSDMNKELLRRMSEVAPGTFQHSIQVGNLAAEIANKIDGKSQLVRTGALYHDIGKILNPIYFTENQSGVNPHSSMAYVDSAQTIIAHVTEGLKLADKYNLPDVIKEFITTHHGLGKAKYFYVQQKNAFPDEPVDDLLFTYPGPNPFTKEQAILMMADTVEAASRSLPDYTEKSIREMVNRLIDAQVAEGYFKECPITFRDIAYAKTVLIEKLKTIYHTRINYPDLKK